MGFSPPEFPRQPELPPGSSSPEPAFVPATPQRDPLWRYVILFIGTVITTTDAGANHYLSFYQGFQASFNPFAWWEQLVGGLWYSVPILAILGCHELGHYYACRYYGVASSRPYFLPMPLLLTGALDACVRLRQP